MNSSSNYSYDDDDEIDDVSRRQSFARPTPPRRGGNPRSNPNRRETVLRNDMHMTPPQVNINTSLTPTRGSKTTPRRTSSVDMDAERLADAVTRQRDIQARMSYAKPLNSARGDLNQVSSARNESNRSLKQGDLRDLGPKGNAKHRRSSIVSEISIADKDDEKCSIEREFEEDWVRSSRLAPPTPPSYMMRPLRNEPMDKTKEDFGSRRLNPSRLAKFDDKVVVPSSSMSKFAEREANERAERES